jgi:hypothetical protein
MIGVVALVGERNVCGAAVDELVRKGDVVALPWRTDLAHRIAERVASRVDFCTQAARAPRCVPTYTVSYLSINTVVTLRMRLLNRTSLIDKLTHACEAYQNIILNYC